MSDRRGFTLIELLVVITILGILASIALPRYSYIKQRAYLSAITSDLHNLVLAQEGFFASNDDYAGDIAPGTSDVPGTDGAGQVAFSWSPDVELVRLTYKNNKKRGPGWNAVATHHKISDKSRDRCGIFIGNQNYSPNKAVVDEGIVACW